MVKKDKDQFRPGDVPAKPGVYVYRDRFGRVIYVGKARNLRRRMSQYFQPSRMKTADPKLRSLIKSIYSWEFFAVKNEDESLILESRLIKDYAPHYNVLMRDDKRYFLLKVNLNEKYPRLTLARVHKDDNALYYGPFPKGTALKGAVDYLNRHFGLRVCKSFDPGEEDHKHCLASIIRDCSEPCVGRETEEGYMARIEEVKKVFEGNLKDIKEELSEKMTKAAMDQRYEQAAKWRDIIDVLDTAFGDKNRSFRFASIPAMTGEESVNDLQEALKLPEAPNLIEGFDISNIGGTLAVASLVCFENGSPARSRYRRYRIKTVDHSDDFAMMNEVIERCYGRRLKENRQMPDLIMVDGGKGQLSSAVDALIKTGVPPLPIIGLAKKHEEIFLPGRSEPIVLDHSRPALRLLQALRDEAHRFAISYHRQLRSQRLQESILDEMPGVGEERKKALLKAFGSLRELRKATPEQIAQKVSGIGPKFAEKLYEFLKKRKQDQGPATE